jgi:hypothetical protein
MRHDMRGWTVVLAMMAGSICGCGEPTISDGDAYADSDIESDGDVDGDVEGDGWAVTPPEQPDLPDPPAPPDPPQLRSWECPEGWLPVEHETLTDMDGAPFSWCEPAPIPRLRFGVYTTPLEDGEAEGDRPICEPAVDGTYPVVGFAECQPLGDPCTDGTFAEIPPEVTGARWYVLAGATDGDGTEVRPVGTIAEAVAAADAGDVIVIGAGTYEESVTLDRDLTLWGRCVRDTIIAAPGPAAIPEQLAGAVIVDRGVTAVIRDLRIGGAQQGVFSQGDTTLEGVWIDRPMHHGVRGYRGRVTLASVLVTAPVDTGEGASGGCMSFRTDPGNEVRATTFEGCSGLAASLTSTAGATFEDVLIRESVLREVVGDERYGGLQAWDATSLTASRLVVDHVYGFGVQVVTGTTTTFEAQDVLVRRAGPAVGAEDLFATGAITLDGDVAATLRRIVLDGNAGVGIQAWSDAPGVPAPTIDGEDLVIRDNHVAEGYGCDVAGSSGLAAVDANVILRRTLIEHVANVGLYAEGGDTTVTDLVLLETWPEDGCGSGNAISNQGGVFSLTRGRIEDSVIGCFGANYAGIPDSTLRLQDVTISDVEQSAFHLGGRTDVTIDQAAFLDSRCFGIDAPYQVGSLTLNDVTIEGTGADPPETCDGSVAIMTSSPLTGARIAIDSSVNGGLSAYAPESVVSISDLTVTGTIAPDVDFFVMPYGLWAQQGATVTLTKARFAGNAGNSLMLHDEGTMLTATDLTVEDVQPLTCADCVGASVAAVFVASGADADLGAAALSNNLHFGAYVEGDGSTLTATDLAITGGAGDGLAVLSGGAATIVHGLLSDNHVFGAVSFEAAALSLEGVSIRDTASSADDGRYGRGLHVEGGGDITVTHSEFSGNRDVSLAAFGAGTTVTLNDVRIRDSLERECVDIDAPADHCTAGRGYGLGSYDGAAVTLDDVLVSDAVGAGVQLARGGVVSGSGLRVSRCGVGINLQDLPRTWSIDEGLADLLLEGNGTDIDETEMSKAEPLAEE